MIANYKLVLSVSSLLFFLSVCLASFDPSLMYIILYNHYRQPVFCDWGFNLNRGEDILKKWQTIPADLDILMTHGPPVGKGLHAFDCAWLYICSAPEISNHGRVLWLWWLTFVENFNHPPPLVVWDLWLHYLKFEGSKLYEPSEKEKKNACFSDCIRLIPSRMHSCTGG